MVLAFSIETSCDETSVAIVNEKSEILSQITSNQSEHVKFGGVVPEIASRAHLEILQQIIPLCLKKARLDLENIDFFCATCGPGLIGGLLVGSITAKSMAINFNKPFYPINHLEGHILSPLFNNKVKFPNITLLVTGGHTQIYLVHGIHKYELLGESVDDAVGESFDKVAKLIKLPYPGGPQIEKLALKGDCNKFLLPHPLNKKEERNFSFSGIKTAASLIVKKQKKINLNFKQNLAASFQKKIIVILEKKLENILKVVLKKNINIKNIAVVGGVAANLEIRKALSSNNVLKRYDIVYPPIELCGDNAAMIGLVGHYKFKNKFKSDYLFKEKPRLTISSGINL